MAGVASCYMPYRYVNPVEMHGTRELQAWNCEQTLARTCVAPGVRVIALAPA
jgi:hypothetical protein